MPGCTHWAAFEHRPTTVRPEREVCLLLWRIENGSCLMDAARSIRAPSTAVVVKCSPFGSTFFRCRESVNAAAGRAPVFRMLQRDAVGKNAGCCSEQAWVFPSVGHTFKPLRHPATCVPLLDPVFPSVAPSLPLNPLSHYHSGCWLVQAGDLHLYPGRLKPTL